MQFLYYRYITIARKPLRLLKAYQYIPSQFDIPQSFLSYLNEPPPPFNPISGDALDDKSFVDIQVAVLRHYLCWRLEMQSAELDVLMKTYSRLKNRSFRLVEESLKILEEKIGFSKEKVNYCCFCYYCCHKCLIHCDMMPWSRNSQLLDNGLLHIPVAIIRCRIIDK